MILHARKRRERRGFTLLEVLLAALIAGLLLAALYAALYTTLLQTQATRDAVEAEDLSRGIYNKISIDLTGTLAPLPPKSGGNAAASGGQVTGGTADTTGMTSTDGSTAPTTTGTGTGSAAPTTTTTTAPTTTDPSATTAEPGATDNATAVSANYLFQGGVVGESAKLAIYAGRVPETFGRYGDSGEQVRSDQRQIIYWYEPGRGLYRRERPWITADGVSNAIEADPDAPDSVLLAEEVTNVLFEYSDGTSWTESWDGTVPGPDGVTPLGPPRAVKVTLDIRVPVSRGEPVTKQVSQIIVVRSAPGTYTPPLLEAPTDAATDSGGTTTDTSGTGGTSNGNTASGGATGNASSGSGTTAGKTGGTTGGATGTTGGKTGGTTGASNTGGGKTGGTMGAGSGNTGGAGNTGGRTGGSGNTGGTGGGTGGGRAGGGK